MSWKFFSTIHLKLNTLNTNALRIGIKDTGDTWAVGDTTLNHEWCLL